MKKSVIIPTEIYEHALAIEKNCFIRTFAFLLEHESTVKKASIAIKARSFEFPLIIQAGGLQALNYQNYRQWSVLANAGKDAEDSCNTLNRIRRLSHGKAGL